MLRENGGPRGGTRGAPMRVYATDGRSGRRRLRDGSGISCHPVPFLIVAPNRHPAVLQAAIDGFAARMQGRGDFVVWSTSKVVNEQSLVLRVRSHACNSRVGRVVAIPIEHAVEGFCG